MSLKVYAYENCDTCRKARRFLTERDITHEVIPIREQPPTTTELKTMLRHVGELRKLFNTSGRDYKEQGLGQKLPNLSDDQAIALLAGNGNLVKRPFVLGNGVALVGFKEEEWLQKIEPNRGTFNCTDKSR
jgi:arsenate reductase